MATPALNPLVEKIRAAHPGAYDDMDDAALTKAVLAKYPQYSDLAAPAVQKPQVNMQTGEGPIAQGLTSFETQLSNLPRNLWQGSFFGEIGNPQVRAAHEQRLQQEKQAMAQPGIMPGLKYTAGLANPVAKNESGVDVGATAANLLPYLLSARGAIEETPTSKLTAPIRAGVQGANKVLKNYPKTVGAGLGGALGAATHLPLARELGAGLGAAVGSEVLPKVKLPGEAFGLPSRITGGPKEAPQYIPPSKVSSAPPEANAPVSLNRLTSDIQSLGYSKADALARAKAGIAKYPNDLSAATTEAMRPSRAQQARAPSSEPTPSKPVQVAQVRASQTAPIQQSQTPTPAAQDMSTVLPRMQQIAQQPGTGVTAPEPTGRPLRIAGQDVPADTNLAPALEKSIPQNRVEGKIMQVLRREGPDMTIGMDKLMEAKELKGLSREQVQAAAKSLRDSGKVWGHEARGAGEEAPSIYGIALRKR